MYRISVIIPVYNAERTLEQTLLSVKAQTIGFENLEVLLCDDHSTDGSPALMQRWADRYANVRLLQTEANSGSASEPRNVCMAHATAPYFMFLDNDDLLEKDACAVLFAEMERSHADVVGGCYSELSGKRPIDASSRYAGLAAGDYDISASFAVLFPAADPFWTKIFKAQIIRDNSLRFTRVYGEDSLFLAEYLACCKKARHIKNGIYIYRVRPDSLYHIFSFKHFCEVPSCYRLMQAYLAEKGKLDYYFLFLALGINSFMDLLADADSLTDDELRQVLSCWWELLLQGSAQHAKPENAVAEILLDDAAKEDFEAAVFHMTALRRLYALRKAQMNEITSSRGWRLLTAVNRLLGR